MDERTTRYAETLATMIRRETISTHEEQDKTKFEAFVKGDNDELYICNYNGDDELDPGTYVGMWQIGDGWTLEVIGGDEGNTDDAAVIKDENAIV